MLAAIAAAPKLKKRLRPIIAPARIGSARAPLAAFAESACADPPA
ncbi:hypothetical protein PXO_03379 [Xanthomonas oryzae pv. oryzae PXO99A]|uniref:Uncharacterized protein n=1 Tax=Xanthomonas oryzae pv. oryzae (strain PXO99A) TaxID=360094 RepID=A0A0K0GFL8_XANOP|nr:hypothetical protein PXO_03379 [Xanthomonas oryzae pv. oryzae PXO99A]